jgi:hypothetical protein
MQIHTQTLGDQSKNVALWVRGEAIPEDEYKVAELFSLDRFAPDARGKRARTIMLINVLWTLQEKLGLRIWTSPACRPEDLLLLMESRNFIRYDREMPLEKWGGILYIEAFNVPAPKWFSFQLEFDKVFER